MTVPLKRLCPALFLGLVLTFGCSHGYERSHTTSNFQRPTRTVAVLPFQNLAGYPKAGDIVTELMITELGSVDYIKVFSPARVEQTIKKMDLNRQQLNDIEHLQALGAELNKKYLIVGSVSEYRYKKGLAEEPVVGINARLVKVNTGEILWSASHSDMGAHFWFSHDSLNRVAQEMLEKMVDSLETQFIPPRKRRHQKRRTNRRNRNRDSESY